MGSSRALAGCGCMWGSSFLWVLLEAAALAEGKTLSYKICRVAVSKNKLLCYCRRPETAEQVQLELNDFFFFIIIRWCFNFHESTITSTKYSTIKTDMIKYMIYQSTLSTQSELIHTCHQLEQHWTPFHQLRRHLNSHDLMLGCSTSHYCLSSLDLAAHPSLAPGQWRWRSRFKV